jgi:hypothetical protein
MTMEEWTLWQPVKNLAAIYEIGEILENPNELRFFLHNTNNRQCGVCVIFEGWVHACRYTDRAYEPRVIAELRTHYNNWTFFRTAHSSYLAWLSEQSCSISNDRELQHFLFATKNGLFEVIDPWEPKIELIPTTKDIS